MSLAVTQHNRVLDIFDGALATLNISYLQFEGILTTLFMVMEEEIAVLFDRIPTVLIKLISGFFCIPLVIILVLIYVVIGIIGYGPMVSTVISTMRLIQHDYDGSDAANKGKLRAALFIFYCLALVHGLCFHCWAVLRQFLFRLVGLVSIGEWDPEVIRGYIQETKLKCANGLRLPAGWNLVAYAVGLLDCVSRDDNLSGVRILDTCVVTKWRSIRLELSSSRRAIQSLITMLGWTSPTLDVQEMRERAARIMADISSELHIAQFPGALESVSSLLEAPPRKPSPSSDAGTTQANTVDHSRHRKSNRSRIHWLSTIEKRWNETWLEWIRWRSTRLEWLSTRFEWIRWLSTRLELLLATPERQKEIVRELRRRKEEERAFKPKGTKELILQGLLILERLAYDEHNCREIVNTPGLLSKITAPITSQAFLHADYDDTWVTILCSSLRVVSRLISAPGEAGTRLRLEISASKEPIDNMLRILESNTNTNAEEPAIDILTEFALGQEVLTDKTKNFGETLALIFVGRSDASRQRRKAGEALAKLQSTMSASGLAPMMEILHMDALVDALVNDKECQICAAEILEHLYFRSERCDELSTEDVINVLTKILGIILSTEEERKADEVAGSDSGNILEVERAGANNNSVIEIDEESQAPKDADQNKSSTEQNDEESEERKLVAALLSLTVVICDKLVDANDSRFVVLVDGVLINKLMDIIYWSSNDTTADCLRILKLTYQVVIAMMKLKPSCIEEFEKHDFEGVLFDALETMSDLDNCMLFAGNDREVTKPARSLASLVKEAHQLFNEAQEPGNNSA